MRLVHMRTSSWRTSGLLLVVALVTCAPNAWSQSRDSRPDDSTAGAAGPLAEPGAARGAAADKDGGAEKDNATRRLEWQRKAFGVPTAEYRRNALKEGRAHASRKAAEV